MGLNSVFVGKVKIVEIEAIRLLRDRNRDNSALSFAVILLPPCLRILFPSHELQYQFSVNLVQCSSELHMTDHLVIISVLFLTSLPFHGGLICVYRRHALFHFHPVISSFIRFSLFWYAFTCFPFEESATLVDWRSSS